MDAEARTAREVMGFVHGHPELGHEEHACSAHVAGRLERAGFRLERGSGGMVTAFRATLAGARPGRSVGMVVLYDAVPAVRPDGRIEPVHSCGHGPIAGGVSAAALALAGLSDRLAGRIVVFGCPADEIHAPGTAGRGGGKALSAAAGLWDGIDAALYRPSRVHQHHLPRLALDAPRPRGGLRAALSAQGGRLGADGGPRPLDGRPRPD